VVSLQQLEAEIRAGQLANSCWHQQPLLLAATHCSRGATTRWLPGGLTGAREGAGDAGGEERGVGSGVVMMLQGCWLGIYMGWRRVRGMKTI